MTGRVDWELYMITADCQLVIIALLFQMSMAETAGHLYYRSSQAADLSYFGSNQSIVAFTDRSICQHTM